MSDGGYKIRNQAAIHFITFAVVEWVDVFSSYASWSVANKLSSSARTGSGDIQFNRKDQAVQFIGELYNLLNR